MHVIPESILTCPYCGYTETMTMPTDSCLYYHKCNQCKEIIKPKAGDCCVFCSYGTAPCPSVQITDANDSCC